MWPLSPTVKKNMGPGSDEGFGNEKVYKLTRPTTGPFISFY